MGTCLRHLLPATVLPVTPGDAGLFRGGGGVAGPAPGSFFAREGTAAAGQRGQESRQNPLHLLTLRAARVRRAPTRAARTRRARTRRRHAEIGRASCRERVCQYV